MQKQKDAEDKKMTYSKASLEDAKISGYTDKNGNAIETEVVTDIGVRRSSAAKGNTSNKKTVEDSPVLGEEQAP
ncbi:MAG: hypothetical protein H7235_03760 [Bdellovibrionaceae bacterium]|nr:hypothetical protein [Pseudobdellovibrionaceae bacterium]